MARQKLVVGNWKMNGSQAANRSLIEELKSMPLQQLDCEVAIAASSIYLNQAAELIADSKVKLAAQDVSQHAQGAFTGEIAADMLADLSCQLCIVGHSERRSYHSESNEQVAEKAAQLIREQIIPIVCIGETLDQRESGKMLDVLSDQVKTVLVILSEKFGALNSSQIVFAYEPVWAIGTGKTATTEQVQQVHEHIRRWMSEQWPDAANGIRILYGGSVKPENAKELFDQADVDGGLIGGASLKAQDFYKICNAAG